MGKSLEQLKLLILCGLVILIAQFTNLKGNFNLESAVIGMGLFIIISMVSLKIKSLIPLKIPAFAWASLISLIITTPWSPLKEIVLTTTKDISSGVIGTVILAVAGISIGCKLDDIKKLSWKIILVAFVVFIGTYFGSALVAEILLKTQGII
ncbi:hypothetical protein [Fusobacterium sp.]|uniref:hypothetical protein n=1 Tax=Fusobacterium sp. TaxID=68766 RepID=UPI0026229D82|nr:hypothetical protein [Fusobacterium sp.]